MGSIGSNIKVTFIGRRGEVEAATASVLDSARGIGNDVEVVSIIVDDSRSEVERVIQAGIEFWIEAALGRRGL